jgi:hypothetical protein
MTAARETGRDDLLQIYDRAHDKSFRQSLPEKGVPSDITQVITTIQNDSKNILEWGRYAVEIAFDVGQGRISERLDEPTGLGGALWFLRP